MNSDPIIPIPSERLLGPGYGPGVWPLRERLALATALLDVDNQQASWNMISRRLVTFSNPNRPTTWCSARACAKQYTLLLESDELTRRNKIATETATETLKNQVIGLGNSSQLSLTERLVKRLSAERADELRSHILSGQHYYSYLKIFIHELESGQYDNQLTLINDPLKLSRSKLFDSGSKLNLSDLMNKSPTTTTTSIKQKYSPNNLSQINDESSSTFDIPSDQDPIGELDKFVKLWTEMEQFYHIPDSTWVCAPGLVGTRNPNTPINIGARSRSTAGGPGSTSFSRLSTLLSEASSANLKPRLTSRYGRKNYLMMKKNNRDDDDDNDDDNDEEDDDSGNVKKSFGIKSKGLVNSNYHSTAASRAAGAAKHRYLAAHQRNRQTATGPRLGRGRPSKNNSNNNGGLLKNASVKPSKKNCQNQLSHKKQQLSNRFFSSQTLPHVSPSSSSGASTPSTIAMCHSDLENNLDELEDENRTKMEQVEYPVQIENENDMTNNYIDITGSMNKPAHSRDPSTNSSQSSGVIVGTDIVGDCGGADKDENISRSCRTVSELPDKLNSNQTSQIELTLCPDLPDIRTDDTKPQICSSEDQMIIGDCETVDACLITTLATNLNSIPIGDDDDQGVNKNGKSSSNKRSKILQSCSSIEPFLLISENSIIQSDPLDEDNSCVLKKLSNFMASPTKVNAPKSPNYREKLDSPPIDADSELENTVSKKRCLRMRFSRHGSEMMVVSVHEPNLTTVSPNVSTSNLTPVETTHISSTTSSPGTLYTNGGWHIWANQLLGGTDKVAEFIYENPEFTHFRSKKSSSLVNLKQFLHDQFDPIQNDLAKGLIKTQLQFIHCILSVMAETIMTRSSNTDRFVMITQFYRSWSKQLSTDLLADSYLGQHSSSTPCGDVSSISPSWFEMNSSTCSSKPSNI